MVHGRALLLRFQGLILSSRPFPGVRIFHSVLGTNAMYYTTELQPMAKNAAILHIMLIGMPRCLRPKHRPTIQDRNCINLLPVND